MEEQKSNEFWVTDGYCRHSPRHQYLVRRLTLDEVKALKTGKQVWFLDRKGELRIAKVNGAVRRWKRDPDRVEVPMKYGLYETFTLTNRDLEILVKGAL